jgi:hypothetical protein
MVFCCIISIANNLLGEARGDRHVLDYFANGHGKGEIDGVGALLKHKIHKE